MTFALSSEIAPALSLLLRRSLASQINWSTPMLALLPKVGGVGKNASATVQFSGSDNTAVAAENSRKAYSDAQNEIEKTATFSWAKYEKVASVTGLAQAVSATTGAAFGNQSLVGGSGTILGSRVRTQFGRMLLGMEAHAFSGDETATPVELGGAARSVKGSGTYGGIDPGTYTEWVSTSGTVTAANLSFEAIREQLLTPIYSACGKTPTCLVTTPALYDKIRALYGSNTVPYLTEMTIPGVVTDDGRSAPARKIDVGGQAYAIDGIPVFRAAGCTSGKVYALNLEHLWIEQLNEMPDEFIHADDRQLTEYFRAIAGNSQLNLAPAVLAEIRSAIRNPQGVVPYFKRLGATGDSDDILIKAYVQTVNNRRNAHGVLAVT